MLISIPSPQHINDFLSEEDRQKAVKNTGHAIVRTKTHIVKFNKNGKQIASLIEFIVQQLMRQLLPDNISDINLLLDKKVDEPEVAAVAVQKFDSFHDMVDVNIIKLIAEIEGFSPSGGKHRYKNSELADELKKYFEDPTHGESRRKDCFLEYITILFLRYLLQEDDGHKGNYGFSFFYPGPKLILRGIDFDMSLYSKISAHFNMVRLSQWGSPFHRFKVTHDDILTYPFMRHTLPGHHPSIEANTLRAHSVTNNSGRYLKDDVNALKFLCEKEDFQSIKNKEIKKLIKKFLEFNAEDFENSLNQYTPESLKENFMVDIPEYKAINFPHIVACAFASIQVSLFAELKKSNDANIINSFLQKYEKYLDGSRLIQHKENFKSLCQKMTAIEAFKSTILDMEKDHFLHFNERGMKECALYFVEFCVKDAGIQELFFLLDILRKDLSHNFVAKSRDSNVIARCFKNHFYNHMTSTYVSIRDILLSRALQLRSKGEDVESLISELMDCESFISSHSKRPLEFTERIKLYGSYAILGNYSALTIKNYFFSKHGFEKYILYSVILTPIILAKDLLCALLQNIPLVLELIVRVPRRKMADLLRYINKKDWVLKIFFNTVSMFFWLISTILQYVTKLGYWFIHKMTCPLIAADEDEKWVEAQVKRITHSQNLSNFLGKLSYIFSIAVSFTLYFLFVKLSCYILPAVSCGLFVVHLMKLCCFISKPLGIYVLSLFTSVGVLLQKLSEKCSEKFFPKHPFSHSLLGGHLLLWATPSSSTSYDELVSPEPQITNKIS